MNSTALDKTNGASKLERVLIEGDLSALSPEEKSVYFNQVCESMGLNPLTKPFAYLRLNGKLVLYATRDCTDQLRKINGVSVERLERDKHDDVYIVTAYVKDRQGRTDVATGAVALANLKGEGLANALMKAETKAKRRATLSICGLGLLDETEVTTIPGATVEDPEAAEGRTYGKRPPEPEPEVTPVLPASELVERAVAGARLEPVAPVMEAPQFLARCESELKLGLPEIIKLLGCPVKDYIRRLRQAGLGDNLNDVFRLLERRVKDDIDLPDLA